MKREPSITAVMNFHREGIIAHPSINSFNQCVAFVENQGVAVEKVAILDKPDATTLEAVTLKSQCFDDIIVVEHGDLGLSRNHGTSLAKSEYVAFFDSDDLWCASWLSESLKFASHRAADERFICHPEYMYWFTPVDLEDSDREKGTAPMRSSYLKMVDSEAPDFDKTAILFMNLYTSNTFARRSLYQSMPFPSVDPHTGFGVEDWWWNMETLAAGVRHAVLPDTVHLVRHKVKGSLSASNHTSYFLPPVHLFADELR